MFFDLHTDMTNGYTFVEELTAGALSFSLNSLENDPDAFVDFLDSISHLRLLPLEEIDTSSKESFCLFVNLYHCLLQHAMLLSISGPIDRRSAGHFMRTMCYEIGGDVFSLAELNASIIRGKMSRPINPKPPYIDASRKSNPYRFYALEYSDARVNFVLVSLKVRRRPLQKSCFSLQVHFRSLLVPEHWRRGLSVICSCASR